MKRYFFFLFFFYCTCSFSLCDLPDSIPYIRATDVGSVSLVSKNHSYNLYDININAKDPDGNKLVVHVHFFENKKAGKLPLLLMIPPIHGVSYRETNVSEHFISCGYHSVVIEPVKNITDSSLTIKNFQKNLLCFITAVRSTIDIFEMKDNVDPKNIFVWAASMGAIYGSIAVGIDSRINAAILIVGGTPIVNIVTESQQEQVVKYRNERIQQEHLESVEDFRKKMKENIDIEVARFTKNRNSSDLLFVIALKDHSVPTQYQFQLAHAFGDHATIIENNGGHAATILKYHLSNLKIFSDFTSSHLRS